MAAAAARRLHGLGGSSTGRDVSIHSPITHPAGTAASSSSSDGSEAVLAGCIELAVKAAAAVCGLGGLVPLLGPDDLALKMDRYSTLRTASTNKPLIGMGQ